MDVNHIIEALRATTVAEGQSQASDYLKQISSVIGFPQVLLGLLQDVNLDVAVRQAAVIYLKNIIYEHWDVDSDEKGWKLSEQDKVFIRQQILPTIIRAPEPIKVHLCTSMQSMMRHDFPEKWPNLGEDLIPLLRSPEPEVLQGALLVLHRLCKIYEYKRQKEKTPLVVLMYKALPILQERITTLLPNQAQPSCFLQKLILKTFFCLVQFSLNPELFPMEQFEKWLHLFMSIVEREVPPECDALPEDERAETVWWKCKKWALKIVERVFDRYGNKGNVDKPYVAFAEHYSRVMVLPVVNKLMECVLSNYINGKFVSAHVLYLTLSHLSDALNQAQVWQVIKPHFEPLLKNIIFPLLQHSKEDEEMWVEDVEEFLRYKYDVYEDLHQPSAAASTLLQTICKRQGILQPVLEFIFANFNATASAHQVDGALHMIAIVSAQLIRSKKYRKDVEKLIDAQVTPRLEHSAKFVRMRACYVLHYASETPFKSAKIIERAITALVARLKNVHEELPIKVEAAIAIQSMLNDQGTKGVAQAVKPHVRDILIAVLHLIADTKVDDLPSVVDTLIENFEEDVIPIAYEVTEQLVTIFNRMVTGEGGQEEEQTVEDHSVGVMGILATLETILGLLEEHPEIVKRVEPIVRSCISTIFECYCESYFEEALSLTHTLVVAYVSPEMWTVYEQIYKAFQEEGTAFFTDCAPVLHAFLTVDTANFLAVPARTQQLLSMCEKTLLDAECDENTKAHAAKMLEVFLLQSQGHSNHMIPDILRLVFGELQKPLEKASVDELRPQLLVILIAAFYCDSQLCTDVFSQVRMDAQLDTFEWFVRELYNNRDNFEGVHDRKMLIWFLCQLLSIKHVPALFATQNDKLMEWMLTIFEQLQRCIKELAERSKEDDSDEEDEESSDDEDERMNGELKDSDDDVDDENMEYLEALEEEERRRSSKRSRRRCSTNKSMDDHTLEGAGAELASVSDTTDSEEYHHFQEETDLEAFTTPLDEQEDKAPGLNVFVLFKHTLEGLSASNQQLFANLCDAQKLGQERVAELKQLIDICTREENLERSKQLAQSGGYAFDANAQLPNSFKFA